VPKLSHLYQDRNRIQEELVSRQLGVDGVTEAFEAMQQGEDARRLITHTH
jgi:Zn-dependent alcohol dehydrogenase